MSGISVARGGERLNPQTHLTVVLDRIRFIWGGALIHKRGMVSTLWDIFCRISPYRALVRSKLSIHYHGSLIPNDDIKFRQAMPRSHFKSTVPFRIAHRLEGQINRESSRRIISEAIKYPIVVHLTKTMSVVSLFKRLTRGCNVT